MELSINYKVAGYKLFGILGLLFVTSFAGLILSMSVPVIFKLGLVLLPILIVVILTVNPLLILNLVFLLRPELELFRQAGMLKLFTGLILVLAFFVLSTKKDKIDFCWDRLKYLYIFTLVSIISLIYTINHITSVVFIFKILSFIAIYLLVFNLVTTREDGIKLLSYFPLAAILPLIYGFYQVVSGQTYVMTNTGLMRFASFFYFANNFAQFLLIILLGSIPLFLYIKKKRKIPLFLLLNAIIITIVILNVRSIWLTILISSFVIAYFLPKLRKHLIVITPVIILLFLPLFAKGFGKVINPNPHLKYSESFYWRLNFWEEIITKVFVRQPILGFGIGTSEEVTATYIRCALMPHNDYLRILLDTGILGVIPYILFLLSNLLFSYRNIHKYKKDFYLNVCGFTLFVSFIFMTIAQNIFYYTNIMWYFLGFLALNNKLNYLSQPIASSLQIGKKYNVIGVKNLK